MVSQSGPTRVIDSSKRLKKLLHDMGIEQTGAACLELSARLLGFNSWESYSHQHDVPLSPLDEDLTDEEFLARDALQLKVLEAQLLDRCDPIGSWRDPLREEWDDGFFLLRRQGRRLELSSDILFLARPARRA